jgi:DNA repair protein RadD
VNAPISSRLFQDAAPDYSNTSFPTPRPFQQSAHESLRQGFREGHRCQLIMAPTGAGKSYLGHRIAHEALLKNRRVVFLCDRTTLVNQTSAGADAYGLTQHGIIQAGHPRRDSSLPYQIASVQTLAKRGFWPETDVLIVDEAHTLHDAWVDFAANNPKTAVIGLSATPFAKGLGQVFSQLINAVTMAELTESGVLVPMRVLSCTKPDMAGAAVGKSGEWTDKAAEERGMAVIGDVIQEWVKHGENRKTIVFAASIAHCKELCRQFVDAGVMAAFSPAKPPPPSVKCWCASSPSEMPVCVCWFRSRLWLKALTCKTWVVSSIAAP